MLGDLSESEYVMFDSSLNAEMESRYKSMDWNERQFIKLYMDLHDIKSIHELQNLMRKYGRVAKVIYSFRRNQVLSVLRYIDENGICGATEWCDDYDRNFNEFLDTMVEAYFKILDDGKDTEFLAVLMHKVNLYKN